jgi:hypothetical protein
MSLDAQRLYDLLPAIYRVRDAEQSEPLKALLSVIAEQVAVLEEDLAQRYDDQFIETCAEWVVPYIGDLIGYRSLHGVAPKVSSPRAAVANTIAYRRRKGTATMLEQLARDVTSWNARAVEFFQLLATTQHMNHIRLENWYAPDLRRWEPLERLNTAFDGAAHTVDVRRIATGEGRYNIPNIGIFLWRLGAYSLTDSPAFKLDERRYLFSPLGNNTPLFTRPETEDEITHLAEPINVPAPISRRVLHDRLDIYYGKGKSLFLRRADAQEITTAEIEICDLSDTSSGTWAHMPKPTGKISIDPVLGRIAFPAAQIQAPLATFHYGFSADMGGGEYERAASFDAELEPIQRVIMPVVAPPQPVIQDALDALSNGGVVEIGDSGRYEEAVQISAADNQRIELRAANGHRPTLVLSNDVQIVGGEGAEISMNGLLIVGAALRVPAATNNKLKLLRLRHCTLVPGLSLKNSGEPESPGSPSLVVESPNVSIEIDHCVIGGLRVAREAQVRITDSIVDATSETSVAYAAVDDTRAGGPLHVINSTVIGKVHAAEMPMASNTIFLARLSASGDSWIAPIHSERKQEGCVRFSFVPPGSRTPRRYRCQPDLEIAKQVEKAESEGNGSLSQAQRDAIRKGIEAWLAPGFTTLRYGLPGYAQLRRSCPAQIRIGADDESEMGAFHDLYQPQRETNLRVRLEEYLRFGLEAGIFYET